MAKENSFDVASIIDRAEITNAINQTMKEVQQRFDFKGSDAQVALDVVGEQLVLLHRLRRERPVAVLAHPGLLDGDEVLAER